MSGNWIKDEMGAEIWMGQDRQERRTAAEEAACQSTVHYIRHEPRRDQTPLQRWVSARVVFAYDRRVMVRTPVPDDDDDDNGTSTAFTHASKFVINYCIIILSVRPSVRISSDRAVFNDVAN